MPGMQDNPPWPFSEQARANAIEALCREMVTTLKLIQRMEKLGEVCAASVRDNLERAELLGLVPRSPHEG